MNTSLIKWQLPMQRVLYGVAPVAAASVYFFGWRALATLAVANAAGFATEYAFTRTWKQPVTSAVFVSSTLFALSLPPPLPLWMTALGIVFGIAFGKMVFGGFGKNIFNPALTGRAFLYISFGAYMTGRWSDPAAGALGGFACWAPDAITGATPGMLLKTQPDAVSWAGLILGRTSGTLGGTSSLLAIAGGLYLLRTRTANYRIVVSGFAAFILVQGLLWGLGVKGAAQPLAAVFGGSFLIGMFFYATDPVSAAQTQEARWLYGAFIGAMSSVITVFAAWPAGTMFAILLANMFAPITDVAVRALKAGAGAKP
jgi:Na+-transporting NADH:ubiquinone oxidoreductase subunit B